MDIGDVVLLLGAVGTLATALVPLLTIMFRELRQNTLMTQKAAESAAKAVEATEEVHKIVNQQRTDMVERIDALVGVLKAEDIPVPTDPAIGRTVDDKSSEVPLPSQGTVTNT